MNIFKMATLAATITFALPVAVQAQSGPLPYGAPIGLDAAKKAVAAAEAEAKKNNFTMVITVVDTGGHVVLMQRMDNTQIGSIRVAEAKARTAAEFRRPTKAFQDAVAGGGEGLRSLATPGVIPMEGGELLVSGGKIVGAIGISGGTPPQDTDIARAGAATLAK